MKSTLIFQVVLSTHSHTINSTAKKKKIMLVFALEICRKINAPMRIGRICFRQFKIYLYSCLDLR